MKSAVLCSLTAVLLSISYSNSDSGGPYRPVTKSTETVTRDLDGNIRGVTVVTTTRVSYSETVTETMAPRPGGGLYLTSRRTATTDTLGNSTTTSETLRGDPAHLTPTSITEVVRGENGSSVTTVRQLQDSGQLEVTQRSTVDRQPDGGVVTSVESMWGDPKRLTTTSITTVTKGPDDSTTTTVQGLDDSGVLAIKRSTTVERNVSGETVTTEKVRDANGQLVITRQSVTAN